MRRGCSPTSPESTPSLPALGYTHFQPAQPTTVGKRATLWIQDLLLDLEELDHRIESVRFRGVRGTTGTQASFLELFEGDHDEGRGPGRGRARQDGLRAGLSGERADVPAEGRLPGPGEPRGGRDLALEDRPRPTTAGHLREVEEPFEKEQIGSSAMPYKRNPMRAERICALTRHVIVLALDPAFTAATQWLERTLDDSANRRLSVPDAFLALDGALVLMENVASRPLGESGGRTQKLGGAPSLYGHGDDLDARDVTRRRSSGASRAHSAALDGVREADQGGGRGGGPAGADRAATRPLGSP